MQGNWVWMHMLILNPYMWLFFSAFFLAMAIKRLVVPIKKNIYHHVAQQSRWFSFTINLIFGLILAMPALFYLPNRWVPTNTPLWLYFGGFLLFFFVLVRYLTFAVVPFILLVAFMAYIDFNTNNNWLMVTRRTFSPHAVMTLSMSPMYENTSRNTFTMSEYVILHPATLDVDQMMSANVALDQLQKFPGVMVIDIAYTYASYPDFVDYSIKGYLMQPRPEFFLWYPAQFFYPTALSVSNADTATRPYPQWLGLFKFLSWVFDLHEVTNDFQAPLPHLGTADDYPSFSIPLFWVNDKLLPQSPRV
jgi:hypothetical protein